VTNILLHQAGNAARTCTTGAIRIKVVDPLLPLEPAFFMFVVAAPARRTTIHKHIAVKGLFARFAACLAAVLHRMASRLSTHVDTLNVTCFVQHHDAGL
jgi:hypothetical protein